MSIEASKISKRSATETDNSLNKYVSLLHILNGEEEFILDKNGFIIGSNLEAVNVTGYEEYEIMGKHISLFYLPEEEEKATTDLGRACRLGRAVVTGVRVKKRGVNFWAKMKIISLERTQHDCPSFRVILQDATHRVISKERIRTLRDEYLAIFNNPFVGTFKFKMEDFVIQMCNQKTLEIFGAKNADVLQLNNFFSSLDQFELFISSLRKDKKLEGFKFLVQDGKDHQETWAIISARYFEAQGFVEGVLFDITEQHSQMVELQRVNAELDNFIYHASHDLRSPLTSIMGLVTLGMKEDSAEAVHNYLRLIRGRIDHLDLLLKDLISVSYNNNEFEKEYELFHFENEVSSILNLLENPNKVFKVTSDIYQQNDFKTDAVRMRAILRNLLSNAFKYYNPEVPVPFIHLHIRVSPSHCAILLKDNGIGIHQKFKNKIFDMFFRATEKSTGSGLGLYIVKSMVEKLNGRVSFESTVNVGTTFLLTIPNKVTKKNSITAKDTYDYMITSKQIELVENSWDYILLNSQETGIIFYRKLFSIDPSLRQLFKGDINVQAQKLVAMITFAVHKLNNLEEIITDVKALGREHKKNSVKVEHYGIVAMALVWTLEKTLGKEWNDEVKEAWIAVYSSLSKIMIQASQEVL